MGAGPIQPGRPRNGKTLSIINYPLSIHTMEEFNMKRIASTLLALALCLGLTVPAAAADFLSWSLRDRCLRGR